MAIVHENSSSANTGYGSSITWAHTTSGSDKILVVCAGGRDAGISVSSITHDGTNLTLIKAETGNFHMLEMWYLVNPSITGNIVVNFSSSMQAAAVANSYTGVHQTTSLGTVISLNSGSGLTSTLNLSSATDEMCVDTLFTRDSGAHTITGGQTLRGSDTGGSTTRISASEEVGAASVDMSWSWSSGQHSQIAVPLKPVGGGGSTPIPVLRRRIEARKAT